MNQIARDEFLHRRRAGIGGSDIAAILGLSKYKTAYDVWLDKRGEAPAEDESDKPGSIGARCWRMWWPRNTASAPAARSSASMPS